SAPPSASSGPAAPTVLTFTGSYTAVPGSLYVPDGGVWSGTKWRGDDAGDGLGEGTLALTVHGNHVEGVLDGALGPATLEGSLFADQVTARIDRKDPSDGGFVGTFDGTLKDGVVEGDMYLSSLVNAHLLRQAKVHLKKGS
ncbi:MAG: hypothetical protein ABI551_18740, partial [Polyangiaceae bacterium]